MSWSANRQLTLDKSQFIIFEFESLNQWLETVDDNTMSFVNHHRECGLVDKWLDYSQQTIVYCHIVAMPSQCFGRVFVEFWLNVGRLLVECWSSLLLD